MNLRIPAAALARAYPREPATVERAVDPTGRPDLTTVRVSGAGAIENRGEIVSWLGTLQLAPARDERAVAVGASTAPGSGYLPR